MKTPREILLSQHRNAEPKLDTIRREVVGELNNQGTKEQSFPASFVTSLLGCSNKLWQELFLPSRRIWSGLATVWVLLFLINFSQRDRSPMDMTKSSTTAETMTTFRDQQKLLNELFADRSLPVDAEPRRIFSPKPRTETMRLETV